MLVIQRGMTEHTYFYVSVCEITFRQLAVDKLGEWPWNQNIEFHSEKCYVLFKIKFYSTNTTNFKQGSMQHGLPSS